jgi:hypothetical protein
LDRHDGPFVRRADGEEEVGVELARGTFDTVAEVLDEGGSGGAVEAAMGT